MCDNEARRVSCHGYCCGGGRGSRPGEHELEYQDVKLFRIRDHRKYNLYMTYIKHINRHRAAMAAAAMRPGLWANIGAPGAGRCCHPLAWSAAVVSDRAGLEAPAIAAALASPSVAASPGQASSSLFCSQPAATRHPTPRLGHRWPRPAALKPRCSTPAIGDHSRWPKPAHPLLCLSS